jgi:pyridoxal biosynthesis lyase PdxS
MDKALLVEKIGAATSELNEAVAHLEKVIGEIRSAPRAEKTSITIVVKEAFAKLNAARTSLEELKHHVEADDD